MQVQEGVSFKTAAALERAANILLEASALSSHTEIADLKVELNTMKKSPEFLTLCHAA